MDDKENSMRVSRAAKRKAAASMAESHVPTKKRAVLGELQNLSNPPSHPNQNQSSGVVPQKQKCGTKTRAQKALPMTKTLTTSKQDKDTKSDDPQICGPYVSDVYAYLHQLEVDPNRRPLPDYIEKVQKDITPNMRGILVDWLGHFAEEYELLSDTLYLSISYVDRFLSLNALSRKKLQLLGVSSMLIAWKYEEISPPHVEDFCNITDNTYTKKEVFTEKKYTKKEVVKMEADLLNSFKFELGNPTVKTFLRRFTRLAQENHKSPNLQLEFLGSYLAELSLLDYNCIKFLPSLVAASVIFLARFMTRPKIHPWTSLLQQYSRYRPADLRECILIIHDLHLSRRGGSLQAVREKYKQHKFKCVATMPSPPEIPAYYFEDFRE
uniref:B-like cyclin n=1 Tax=Ziziphus jujuba TaxID=326968 RepID=A0A6P4ATX8_ZIZJJ